MRKRVQVSTLRKKRLKSPSPEVQHPRLTPHRVPGWGCHTTTFPSCINTHPKPILEASLYMTYSLPEVVRSFLGLTGYYQRFVKGFSVIASTLRKGVKFEWDDKCQSSFELLKKIQVSTLRKKRLKSPSPEV